MSTLIEKPLFELIAGLGVLAAFGSYLVWNMRSARASRTSSIVPRDEATEPVTPDEDESTPTVERQPLPLLASRLRPLAVLRERDRL